MRQYPDGEVSASTKPTSAAFKIVRIFAKSVGYTSALLVVAVVVGYNVVMRPAFLEPLIKKNFAAATNGTLEIKIAQASLFRGFKFRDVVVHPPQGFKATPIFKAREINLLYNVYGFFRGKFGVHDVSLHDTEVYLEQKNNIYNVQALLKPSSAKKPEEAKKSKSASVISWFFDVELFAHLALVNFNFTLDASDHSNTARQTARLDNFNFRFSLLTKSFNKVDTADIPALVDLLNGFIIDLNPQKTIAVQYSGPAAHIDTKLDMNWRLFYDGQSRRPEFISSMRIGDDKIPLSLKGRAAQNLSFLLEHRIDYDAKNDKLAIQNFIVKFLGDTLLSLTGTGDKLLTKNRNIEIQTGASRVNLGSVYTVLAGLTGKRDPVYSGIFSIAPTTVAVRGSTIQDRGGIRLQGVRLRKGALSVSVPSLEFDHAAEIDRQLKPLPVKSAEAKLKGNVNGAAVLLDAVLAEKRTAVNFSLRGFDVSPFARGSAQGLISATFSAVGESLHQLAIALRVFSPQLYYFVDRGKSGVNRIDFNARGSVKSSEDFKQIAVQLPVLNFLNKDKDYNAAVDLKSRVAVEKGQATHVRYNLDQFTVAFKPILQTLPAGLRESMSGSLATFNPGRTLRVDGETQVAIAGGQSTIAHATNIAVPDIHIDDIAIKAKTRLNATGKYIDQFSITGLRQALKVSAQGAILNGTALVTDTKTGIQKRVSAPKPDLKFAIELSRSTETEILDGTYLEGVFTLAGIAKGDIVDGKIKIDNLSFRNRQARVNKINLDFPFKHDLKLKKTLNLRAGNKERIIKNYNFNRAYNFTIGGIDIPNPNDKKEWLTIVYPRGNYPAVGASMEYKDNVFVMPVLQMYMLNGVVTISDTLFNFGRLVPSEMEYLTTIQVKDIDLKQIMVKDKADSITDGKLRIDILFTGNRLDKPVENLSGYFSVFYIGPEFAQMVMRAANPKTSNMISSLAASAATPKRIDITIREGFVYNNIPMNVGVLGSALYAPKEVKNDRINIPEFFQRISDEASVYRSSPAE